MKFLTGITLSVDWQFLETTLMANQNLNLVNFLNDANFIQNQRFLSQCLIVALEIKLSSVS